MSDMIVEICKINDIRPHGNADSLQLATIKGWQTVIKISEGYKNEDLVVYFPPDSVLPDELANRLGVTSYLSKGRVRAARLRGEPSFGFPTHIKNLVELNGIEIVEGLDVAEILSVTKYEPPVKPVSGQTERDHILFPRYTNIQSMQNYPYIAEDGETWVWTEKVHGRNQRGGIVEGEFIAGSHNFRIKNPGEELWATNVNWFPLSLPPVRSLVESLYASGYKQVILYGEVYGPSIQSMGYGVKTGVGFRAFDLLLDGKYVDSQIFLELCQQSGIETCRIIGYSDKDHLNYAAQYSIGSAFEGNHIREGVVGRPLVERTHPKLGRVILKYVSADFKASRFSEKEVADV